jgi:hypothetical protein
MVGLQRLLLISIHGQLICTRLKANKSLSSTEMGEYLHYIFQSIFEQQAHCLILSPNILGSYKPEIAQSQKRPI